MVVKEGMEEELKKRIPKKYHHMIDCGDYKKVNQLLAMVHTLMSVAVAFSDDAHTILSKYGLNVNEVRYYSNKVEKFFDLFCGAYHKLIGKEDGEMITMDYHKFRIVSEKFMASATEDDFVHINRKTGRVVKNATDETEVCLILGKDNSYIDENGNEKKKE